MTASMRSMPSSAPTSVERTGANRPQRSSGRVGVEVLVGEHLPDLLGAQLAALGVGAALHDVAELDLEAARQVQAVLGLEQVGHPALAGLAVDAHDGLVGAADVVRVDRQVGHAPVDVVDVGAGGDGAPLHVLEALLDGVLVRAGEGRVDEVAAPRVPLVHRQLVAVLDGAADLGHVGEVDLRVDALAEQVHAQGDEADVAGALAVAEQAALDAVGAGEVAQLGRGDALAAVVVRVQAHDDRLAAVEVAHHPLDGVGVDVGGGHLHRRGEVDDHLVVGRRVDDRDDLVADPHRELELGAGVGLRGVLVVDVGLGDRSPRACGTAAHPGGRCR